MKTSELTGTALDWAVSEAEGCSYADYMEEGLVNRRKWSTNWAQGGPIIAREGISLLYQYGDGYEAYRHTGHTQKGETPLIAAMRCYCCAKLGDEVEIPEELL